MPQRPAVARPAMLAALLSVCSLATPAMAQEIHGQRCAGTPAERPVAFLLTAPPKPGDTTVTVTVCLRAGENSGSVGSYRGELRFDAAGRVAGITRGRGGMRMENTTRPGTVLFAGAAPTGFRDSELLTVTIAFPTPVTSRPPVALVLREVSSTGGGDLLPALEIRGTSAGAHSARIAPDSPVAIALLDPSALPRPSHADDAHPRRDRRGVH